MFYIKKGHERTKKQEIEFSENIINCTISLRKREEFFFLVASVLLEEEKNGSEGNRVEL